MAEEEIDIVRAIMRGFSRAFILWLISQKPMSGYTVIKEIEKLTGQKFHAGIVYPLLYELEENKFIIGKWTQKGRRRIKYYLITEKGTQMLNQLRKRFEMPVKEVLKDFIKEKSCAQRDT
jgi:DNA-binding PadR family transcriptional regulator